MTRELLPLDIKGLSIAIEEPIFSAIDLTLRMGDFVTISGEKGSGKSLFVDSLMGYQEKYKTGKALFWGEEYTSVTRAYLNKRIGWITSHEEDYPLGLNVKSFLKLISPFYNCWDSSLVEEMVTNFELDPTANLSQLKDAERAKLKLVKALAFHPDLLIVDDLTSDLSDLEKQFLLKTLATSFTNDNLTVLYMMNSKEEAPTRSTAIYQLSKSGLSKK